MKILGISGGMRNGSNDGMCIEALMGAKEMGSSGLPGAGGRGPHDQSEGL